MLLQGSRRSTLLQAWIFNISEILVGTSLCGDLSRLTWLKQLDSLMASGRARTEPLFLVLADVRFRRVGTQVVKTPEHVERVGVSAG